MLVCVYRCVHGCMYERMYVCMDVCTECSSTERCRWSTPKSSGQQCSHKRIRRYMHTNSDHTTIMTLHDIALHYIAPHCVTLHYTTVHYTTSAIQDNLQYMHICVDSYKHTLRHYTALHYTTTALQYITSHHIAAHTYVRTYIHTSINNANSACSLKGIGTYMHAYIQTYIH